MDGHTDDAMFRESCPCVTAHWKMTDGHHFHEIPFASPPARLAKSARSEMLALGYFSRMHEISVFILNLDKELWWDM